MRNIALVVAVVLGILAALGVHHIISKRTQETKRRYRGVDIVRARVPIAKGEKINPDVQLERDTVAQDLFNEDYVSWQSREALAGREAVRDIARMQPIMWSHFVRDEVGQIRTPGLDVGERAVTISVDSVAGVAGLLRPGDHVDIFCTLTPTATKGRPEVQTVRVLSNVGILATDNFTTDVQASRSGRGSYSTITLVLSPEEAPLIIYLANQGRLILARRHILDNKHPPRPEPVTGTNVLQRCVDAEKDRQMRQKAETEAAVSAP